MAIVALLPLLAGCAEEREPVAVGTLERNRIELRADRQEPIVLMPVREGDYVQTGDVLVELDRRRMTAELNQTQAVRDRSAARLAELTRGARKEKIEETRAQVAEAEVVRIARHTDLVRIRSLATEEVESESVLDGAEAAYAAAEARLAATEASLDRLLNGTTVEELDQQRADLAQQEAKVAKLGIDLERMIVAAPRPGLVDALPFEVGDEPPAGSVVAVLLTEEAPFARVYIPAGLRPSAFSGKRVRVAVEGYPKPFDGRVRFVSSEATFTPYFALTDRDRGHLAYLAEIDLVGDAAAALPTGLPVEVTF